MLSNKSNKELVEVGHQFAKALDADMPLTEIAKLVSALSTRLDCAIVRGDELQQKLDAMAAENAALKSVLEPKEISDEIQDLFNDTVKLDGDSDGYHEWSWVDNPDEVIMAVMKAMPKPETPATDAYLNSVRAEGVEILTSRLQTLIDEGVFDAKEIGVAAGAVYEGAQIAANLRSGTHDTADKAG